MFKKLWFPAVIVNAFLILGVIYIPFLPLKIAFAIIEMLIAGYLFAYCLLIPGVPFKNRK